MDGSGCSPVPQKGGINMKKRKARKFVLLAVNAISCIGYGISFIQLKHDPIRASIALMACLGWMLLFTAANLPERATSKKRTTRKAAMRGHAGKEKTVVLRRVA